MIWTIRADRRSDRLIAADYGVSQNCINRIRRRQTYRHVPEAPGTPEPNSYTTGVDAAEFLRRMPRGLLTAVVCRPPGQAEPDQQEPNPRDNRIPPDEYIAQRREFLQQALDAVGGPAGSGCVVYQHAPTIGNCRMQHHHEHILHDLPVRQHIIWAKPGTTNPGEPTKACLPRTWEYVTLIAGDRWELPPSYRHRPATDVWHIASKPADRHQQAFPVQLAAAMLTLCPEQGAVCDPFAGAGTVGIAASRMGKTFYLADRSAAYRQTSPSGWRPNRRSNDCPKRSDHAADSGNRRRPAQWRNGACPIRRPVVSRNAGRRRRRFRSVHRAGSGIAHLLRPLTDTARPNWSTTIMPLTDPEIAHALAAVAEAAQSAAAITEQFAIRFGKLHRSAQAGGDTNACQIFAEDCSRMAIQSGQLASIATNCTAIINERMPEANPLAAIRATDAEAEALLTMRRIDHIAAHCHGQNPPAR